MLTTQYLPISKLPFMSQVPVGGSIFGFHLTQDMLSLIDIDKRYLDEIIAHVCDYVQEKGCSFKVGTVELYPHHPDMDISMLPKIMDHTYNTIDSCCSYWLKVEKITLTDGFIFFILS